jgi:hypothetical protein
MSIKTIHNAGFFSCCSVRLYDIVKFINDTKQLPQNVDSSTQFEWYKNETNEDEDITFDYFKHYSQIDEDIKINETIMYHHFYQFEIYSKINYENLLPLVKKYFSSSDEICRIIDNMEKKYNIDYDNVCVLFYRGNDKIRETVLCNYSEYLEFSNNILEKNLNIKFLIQSDETEFIVYMRDNFPNNSFYFNDEIRHMNKQNDTVDIVMKEMNYQYSKYYLAITILMSKCKYVICGSGNCSIWIALYRGHSNGIIQNLNEKWYIL